VISMRVAPLRLGVNLDHVATVRQARRTTEPDPVAAAILAEIGGADQITIHLREDRRHISDRDLRLMRETSQLPLNQEMGVTDEMLDIACEIHPDVACLVPERREEISTEGGLSVVGNETRLADAARRLHDAGIVVSLFIDPSEEQIRASREIGADAIELHTGEYANTQDDGQEAQLIRLRQMAELGNGLGLKIHAGHGLTYQNVSPVSRIPEIVELNIGHSIIARSIYVGLQAAVAEMRALMDRARMDTRLGTSSDD
jgi:pyridoxine 5-phosphate synthase